MTAPQVGQIVQYLGHENTPMAATVIMTASTYQAAMDPLGKFEPADETTVSLKITRPVSGREYVRHNVPLEGSPAHEALAQAAAEYVEPDQDADDQDEDSEQSTPPAPRPVVRFWRPVK